MNVSRQSFLSFLSVVSLIFSIIMLVIFITIFVISFTVESTSSNRVASWLILFFVIFLPSLLLFICSICLRGKVRKNGLNARNRVEANNLLDNNEQKFD